MSPSNHPRPDHAPIVIVIQSEHMKHSTSPRNQSPRGPNFGCFRLSGVVIGSALSKDGALVQRLFARVTFKDLTEIGNRKVSGTRGNTASALNGKFNYTLLFLRNYIYKSKLSEETLLLPEFVNRFNLR